MMGRFYAGLICLILLAYPAGAEETIVKFLSDVTVNTDASLDVVETISVLSDGTTIRHGIFRDFPTRYTDQHGINMRVDFEVRSVMRNATPENYAIESLSNGVRVKIGDKDVLLQPGIHKYLIKYHTTRQIGFFDTFDELYWNVTGNGWPYPIQYVDVNIHLPNGALIGKTALYTGAYGATGSDAEVQNASGNQFAARATRILAPNEGLTVAVAWQKNIVTPPTAAQQQMWRLRDNAGYAGLAATLLSALGYFLFAWNKVGRDPAKGTIIPLFKPPEDLGPAGVRYIWKRGFDDRIVAAALVGLAVKGRLKIENDDGEYAITPMDHQAQMLSTTESILLKLVPHGRTALKQSNNASIRAMKSGLESYLDKEYQGAMFVKNLGWLTIGIILSLLGLGLSAFLAPDPMGITGLFVGGFAAIWWGAILAMGWAATKGLISADGFFGKLKSLVALIFLVPFTGAGVAVPVAIAYSEKFSPPLVVFIAATIAIGLIVLAFSFLMPAPTFAGRRILDAIEGFRLYLTTAEEKRLDALNPPEKTPELFERYLPYAMALDCENAWNAKFAAVLAAAAAVGAGGTAWYYGGNGRNNNWGSMTSSLGNSLASTISTSSTAPGSSSGSGGGGASGGGGGGGGGGGW
jgi:uncharacterized membrane protein YgcG